MPAPSRSTGRTRTPDVARLLLDVVRALGTSNVLMAQSLGISPRTMSRWATRRSKPSDAQLAMIARSVRLHDPALADRVAALVKAPAARLAVEAGAPTPLRASLVDSAVCAAADSLELPPHRARPALLAFVTRARSLGLDLAALEQALGAPGPARKA